MLRRLWHVAALVPLLLAEQGVPATSGTTTSAVTVELVMDSAGGVWVHERYRLGLDSLVSGATLQYLARPCVAVGVVERVVGRTRVVLASTPNGPWRTLGNRSAAVVSGNGATDFEVEYRVTFSGPELDIPLVHPTQPIPRREGQREGDVTIRATIDDARAIVSFPHLRREAGTTRWSGRFVAIPSFVQIARPGGAQTPCAAAAPGNDGGLTWRFWLLVGIMVAWVPIYLTWAGRRTEGDA